ncbi:MAG: hypothetical protein N2484_01560 [Clostridia bacterium]|nr:hypothetical protein [Clostridia bacterium]
MNTVRRKITNKKILAAIGLGVIILGIATYFIYSRFQPRMLDVTVNDNQPDSSLAKQAPNDKPTNKIGPENSELKKYLDNVKNRDKLQEYELIQVLSDDLDGDGKKETLASFGSRDLTDTDFSDYKYNYLFKHTDKGVVEIKLDFDPRGYFINGVKIIRLDESKTKYIYLKITNGASPLGCAVYVLHNDKLENLFSEASATGAGEYRLVDDNNDGIFEEIVSFRQDYGVQYHRIETHHQWTGKDFKKEVLYFLDEYPKGGSEVIEHYLDLLWLEKNYGANTQTRDRIKELLADEEIKKVDVSEYVNNLFNEESSASMEKNLKFEPGYQGGHGMNLIVDLKDGTIKEKLNFEIEQKGDKFKIASIIKMPSDLENEIVGLWHVEPHVSAGYGALYYFYPNKTFHFKASSADGENRNVGYKGNWVLQSNKLRLHITKEEVLVGGHLEDSPSAITGKAIVDGEIIEKDIKPVKIMEYDLGSEADEQGSSIKTITNSKAKFYRISEAPDI